MVKLPDNTYTHYFDTTDLQSELYDLKFRYGDVKYEDYQYRYSLFSKKVALIPALAGGVQGIVLSVYHLGLAILNAGDATRFKVLTFTVVRDLQGSFGHFVSLFDAAYGSYHAEESEAQKICYSAFLSNYIPVVKVEKKAALPKDPEELIDKIKDKDNGVGVKLYQLAVQYKENNDLENAYKVIQDYQIDGTKKEEFISQLAEAYCNLGEYDKALEMLNDVSGEAKGKLHHKIAQKYFEEGNLEKAYKMIDSFSVDSRVKGNFIAKLAERYFADGNLEKAYKMIDSFSVDSSVKESFIAKLAERYFADGDLERAYKMIDKVSVKREVKGPFLQRLAEKYFAEGKLTEAYKMIDSTSVDNHVKGVFLTKLAEKYFAEGNLIEAYKMIDSTSVDNHVKGVFLTKLAERYYADDMLEEAYKRIDSTAVGTHVKGAFFARLAEQYFAKGYLLEAYEMIDSTSVDNHVKGPFVTKLAERYFTDGNLKEAYGKIDQSYIDDRVKKPFILKLVQKSLENGNIKDACEMIASNAIDPKNKKEVLDPLAKKMVVEKDWDTLFYIAKVHPEDLYLYTLLQVHVNENENKAIEVLQQIYYQELFNTRSTTDLLTYLKKRDVVVNFLRGRMEEIKAVLSGEPKKGMQAIKKILTDLNTALKA